MILDQAWREEHVRIGDKALADADELARDAPVNAQVLGAVSAAITTFAAIAQAHYAAANVRARPRAETRD
jgi:hypothetical protein